ncbi:MAG: aminopeptidase [Clostridiaceae bacterium]|nr:aminopeptidase [Clostridiaceae bacterium]
MRDSRLDRLAEIFLTHSLTLEKGDGFLVSASTEAVPLVKAILRKSAELGVYPVVELADEEVTRLRTGLFDPADPAAHAFLESAVRWDEVRWQDLKGRIAIRGTVNAGELSDIPQERMKMVAAKNRPIQDLVINHRKWVLFDWPTRGMAQKAGMSYDRFFDYTMEVSDLDYARLEAAETVLAGYLDRADQVRIEGPGTELSFSIAGIPTVCCCGRRNIPDGEVYTAPVEGTLEGVVTYNVPTVYWGRSFRNVRLEFRGGVIVASDCDGDKEALQAILDSDPGARKIGEFSFGVNNAIREPIGNILFDEKIGGSFHLTPGAAYAKADNGNRSSIHWDLVSIQRPEYGGGRIWLDGVLLREDGLFLPEDLLPLNP